MRFLPLLQTLFVSLFTGHLTAQNFAFPIGSELIDEGGSTLTLGPGGDYYIGGQSGGDGLICRISNEGNIIWTKSIDFGDEVDYVLNLEITSDNYLIGSGNCRDGGGFNAYAYAFKMDLDGDFIWSRKMTVPGESIWAFGIGEAANGNYRIAGSYTSIALNNYVVEYDNVSGATVWDTVYSNSSLLPESFYDVITHESNDASYFSSRTQIADGGSNFRAGLSKISAAGDYEWTKTYIYPSGSFAKFFSYTLDQDADSIVLGLMCREGGDGPPYSTGIIKTDLDGNIGWAKKYTNPGNDIRCHNMINLPDGYLLSGWKQNGDQSLFMIKTDNYGNVIWSKFYGGLGEESVWLSNSNSRVILDGEYVVTVGRSDSYSASFDLYLVKALVSDGTLTDGSCFDDMLIETSDLPLNQYDYYFDTYNLPISINDPGFPMTTIDYDYIGAITEETTDTIASGDTFFICPGDEVQLYADWYSELDFLWSTGEATQSITVDDEGTYWVDVSGGGGCLIWSDTIYVEIGPMELDLEDEISVCAGESIVLDAGDFDGTYLWNTGHETRTITVDEPGVYSVEVIGDGCSGSDETVVHFSDPWANYIADKLTGCAPLTVQFNDLSTVESGSVVNWSWTFGDGGTSNLQNPTHIYTEEGEFTVSLVITSDAGCMDDTTQFDYVITTTGATADFSYTPDYITFEDVIFFTSFTTNATDWFWDFGDGNSSNAEHPQHKYDFPGTYVVTLIATNDSGCNSTMKKTIIVDNEEYIYVPNVFSPDGDDFNEIWKPSVYGIDLYNYHVTIFNRWGEIVWESFDASIGWDGTYGGELVPDGTYVWILEYGDLFFDDNHKLEGFVIVLK